MNLPTNNSLQNLISEQERKREMSFSYYKNQESATEEQVNAEILKLRANYDRKSIDFWKALKDIILEEKWSIDRLKYAARRLMFNVKFHTWTIAEFMEMDRTIERWSGSDAETRADHNKELAYANFGDHWYVCYKEDAERLGLEHRKWVSDKQQKRKVEDYD